MCVVNALVLGALSEVWFWQNRNEAYQPDSTNSDVPSHVIASFQCCKQTGTSSICKTYLELSIPHKSSLHHPLPPPQTVYYSTIVFVIWFESTDTLVKDCCCHVQPQPAVRLMARVEPHIQHDFDAQPLCEVSIQLSLRNCLQSHASLRIETSLQDPQHQDSGEHPSYTLPVSCGRGEGFLLRLAQSPIVMKWEQAADAS